jgi:hypothetical protein
MAEFVPVSEGDEKALRALVAAQRQLRRIELRIAIKSTRVQLARVMKASRPMRTVSDLRWHGQVTGREAQALELLANATKARGVVTSALTRVRQRLLAGGA